MERRKTKRVYVGSVPIGGGAPIAVQSMTNARADDFEGVYGQIRRLEEAGCDIVRITVPDIGAVRVLAKCKEAGVRIPIVADIHFDYRMAIEAANAGADKIRINPGNIGGEDRVKAVVAACRAHRIPIRIGVNGGSLEKPILAKYGAPTPEALVESAKGHIALLEKYDFDDIIVAIKSSSVPDMIRANELMAQQCAYPFHLGVTEAGTAHIGLIKSSIGIGSLLCRGIGDTLRVSLTADPVLEVREGRALLRSLSMDESFRLNIVSCPTCGRTKIDLIGLAGQFEARAAKEIDCTKPLTVAIMGCAVNGPGEAKNADIGIAGGDGEGILFARGKTLYKVPEDKLIDALIDEIRKMNG